MVGTIGLAGSESREKKRMGGWWVRIGVPHLVGSMLGGAGVGFVVAFLGALTDALIDVPTTAVVGIIGLFVLAETVGVPAKMLSRTRQVPLSWKHVFPATASAPLYGAFLGMGVTTTIYYWSHYALLAAVFFSSNLAAGSALGALFGLGRAAPVIGSAFTSPAVIDRWTDLLKGRTAILRVASVLAMSLTAWALLNPAW